MVWINWKFIKIRKRKIKKGDGLKVFIWPNFRSGLYQYIVEIDFFIYIKGLKGIFTCFRWKQVTKNYIDYIWVWF